MKKLWMLILLVLLGGVLAFVAFKALNNDVSNEQNDSIEWIEYLDSQNLVFKTSIFYNDECHFETMDLTSSDIEEVLDKLSKVKITKRYYSNPPSSSVCNNRYSIEYGNNKISLENSGVAWIRDNNLSNKLDKVIVDTIYDENAGTDYVYVFDIEFDLILSEYVGNVNNNNEWVNYLNQFDLVLEKSEFNYDKDECEYKALPISKDIINDILNVVSSKRLTKYYYGSFPPTSSVCNNNFILKYGNNKLFFYDSGKLSSDDTNLINKLELTVDKITYAEDSDDKFAYIFDIDVEYFVKNYK